MVPTVAESGARALELAKQRTFDVVVSDVQMPEMDGWELAALLQANEQFAGRPLIVLSSSMERAPDGLQFHALMNKPVKAGRLYSILRSVLDDPDAKRRAEKTKGFDSRMGEQMPLKILLAEDVLMNQNLMLRVLSKLGYRAEVANDGAEAVAAVQRDHYDVVLMDMQMPIMDGPTACRQIREHLQQLGKSKVAVIALTANASPADRAVCMAAGMDDFLVKPLSLSALKEALERVYLKSA